MANILISTHSSKETGINFRKIPTCLAIWIVENKKADAGYLWMVMRGLAVSGRYELDIDELCGITGYNTPKVKRLLKWLQKSWWINQNEGHIYLISAKRVCKSLNLVGVSSARYYFLDQCPFEEFCVAVGIETLKRSLVSSIIAGEKRASIHRDGVSNSLIAKQFGRSKPWAIKWKYRAQRAGALRTERRFLDTGLKVEELWEMRSQLSDEIKTMVIHRGLVRICRSNYIKTEVEVCRF
jgi:hypothetical protein